MKLNLCLFWICLEYNLKRLNDDIQNDNHCNPVLQFLLFYDSCITPVSAMAILVIPLKYQLIAPLHLLFQCLTLIS